jgi:periplasmic protein TonB
MRKYTLVFSIVAHVIAVGALIIVPALATDDLPEPRRTSAFIIVKPEMPQPIAMARHLRNETPSITTPVPLTPPETVIPETIVAPVDLIGVDLGAPLTRIPVGEVVSNGELVPPPPAQPRSKEPVRVGGQIEPPKRLVHVDPIYPAIAIAARKEGSVILEALISEEGIVREVHVLRPAPLFEQAAITAVRQWRFSPTLLNGEPVPIVMTVTIGFTLTR